MAEGTGIEWTDRTWNPIQGCSKATPGCDNCYAITAAHRMRNHPNPAVQRVYAGLTTPDGGDWTGTLRVLDDRLDQPLRWGKPQRVFVNSMSDLFHPGVPTEDIARVFAVMALASRHTFQVLTKRHGRMRSLLTSPDFRRAVERVSVTEFDGYYSPNDDAWPLPNVWLGVSVEDQARADLRVPALLDTPAAVRFLSCEPLLGRVTLPKFCACGCGETFEAARRSASLNPGWLNSEQAAAGVKATLGIDWVIVGGESGPAARPMHPDWARSLRDQCQDADVAYLFKQWGEWAPSAPGTAVREARSGTQKTPQRSRPGGYIDRLGQPRDTNDLTRFVIPADWAWMDRVGKKQAGRVLDGRVWDEYPAASTTTAIVEEKHP